jgi:hypothetical protein
MGRLHMIAIARDYKRGIVGAQTLKAVAITNLSCRQRAGMPLVAPTHADNFNCAIGAFARRCTVNLWGRRCDRSSLMSALRLASGAETTPCRTSLFFANERQLMPFKPKYNLRRADRQRAQQQKHEEKEQRRQERAAQRKGERDTIATAEDAPGNTMARKQQPSASGFVLFDVVYEDGTRSSNRKVAIAELDAIDPDASARLVIEAQDGRIAEISGRARRPIKSISRSADR